MEFQRVHQQLLQSHHLFEPLSPVQLQELLASSDLVNLDKGAYVFRQGEPAHAFYYLISRPSRRMMPSSPRRCMIREKVSGWIDR